LVVIAADANGAVLGAVAVVGAGLWVEAAVGASVDDAAAVHAESAIASTGTRMAMDRFIG